MKRAILILVAAAACGDNLPPRPSTCSPADNGGITTISLPPASSSFSAGDFDQNGSLDFVVTEETGALAIVLADGTGGYQRAALLSTGRDARAAAVADFNGDGHLDVAFVDYYQGAGLVLGNGDGTFGAPTFFPAGAQPWDMVAGDINGDNVPDLVVVDEWDGTSATSTILVLANSGNGTFSPYATITGSPGFLAALGDFNGDTKLDVASDLGSGVCIYTNNGDGTFATHTCATPVNTMLGRFTTGDFDGDGRLDIAAGASEGSSSYIAVFRGQGDGTLAAPSTVAPGTDAFQLVAADVDRNGSVDLVAKEVQTPLSVLLNQGDGTFAPGIVTDIVTNSLPSPDSVIVADIRGDGHLDAAVLQEDTITVVSGHDNGRFGPVGHWYLGGDSFPCVFGDYDGDAQLDIACATATTNVALNLLYGIWSLGAAASGPGLPSSNSMASADFTGDGRADIVVEDRENGDAFVLAGQADRSFTALPAFAWLPSENVAAGDVNGDGRIDVVGVVQAPYSAGYVETVLNGGNGVFGPMIPSFTTGYAGLDGAVALGDVDHDGNLDLVVTAIVLGSRLDGVAVMLGSGDGHFAFHRWYRGGVEDEYGEITRLQLADLDGDGNLDLVVQEYTNNTIGVMFGHGDGSFDAVGATGSVTGLAEGYLLAVGDVTGDGLADVVVVSATDLTEISILENLGGRAFGPPQAVGGIGNPQLVTITDVDGDGHNDIVVVDGVGVVSVLQLVCRKQP